jgi:predicted dehydrogenase/sugar phosphate isomerase/epimerase
MRRKKEVPMRLSCFTDELRLPDIAVALDRLAGWGLEQVCLRGGLFGSAIDALDAEALRRLRALLDARGLRVAALQSSLAKVHLPDAGRRQAEAAKLERLIIAADILDCRLVRAFNYWQPGREGQGRLAQEFDQLQLVLDAFAPLAERARAAGLQLAFENCGQSCADVAALCKALDVPGWGLAWDAWNDWSSAERQRDTAAFIARQARAARMVHVKAAAILPELGHEPLPWERILAACMAAGVEGPASVETHLPAGSALGAVGASQACVAAVRRAWPTDTPSDIEAAAAGRRAVRIERPWSAHPVGFGVIGLGMGANRAARIVETDGCRLVGVCDLVAERARVVGERHRVPWHTDAAALLADPACEVAFVVTETGNHAATALQALAAGRHVISTKPMEATAAACRTMIDAARAHGRLLAVDFERRFRPEVRSVAAAVKAGWFGRLRHVRCQLKIWRGDDYFAVNDAWHGTWRLDGGGAGSNQGIHHIDDLVHWFGLPAQVWCHWATQAHRIEADDVFESLWRYDDGLLVSFGATTTWQAGGWYHRCEVGGSDGCLLMTSGGCEPARCSWWRDGTWSEQAPLPPAGPDWINTPDNMAAALRSGAPLVCDGLAGQASRRVLEACYASAAAGGIWQALER